MTIRHLAVLAALLLCTGVAQAQDDMPLDDPEAGLGDDGDYMGDDDMGDDDMGGDDMGDDDDMEADLSDMGSGGGGQAQTPRCGGYDGGRVRTT